MYHVIVNGKIVGKFGKRQQADDYAKTVAGIVKVAPTTQDTKPSMEKLTQ